MRALYIGDLSAAQACAFFDSLPPSRLHTLDVSLAVGVSRAEEATVVEAITRYLVDPVRSRSVKSFCPSFESFEATYAVAHTLLGSYDAVEDPALLHTQIPNLSVVCAGLDGDYFRNDSIKYPTWMHHSRFSHYKAAVQRVEHRNRRVCKDMRQEALALLCAARIFGCRARFLGKAPGVFPLHELPSELRIRILSMLAPHLDDTQTMAVLSWACCAATIGSCCKRRADPRPPLAPTLDVPPWDWDNYSTCGSHFGPKPYAVSDISSVSNLAAFLESTGTNVASMNHWYTYGR